MGGDPRGQEGARVGEKGVQEKESVPVTVPRLSPPSLSFCPRLLEVKPADPADHTLPLRASLQPGPGEPRGAQGSQGLDFGMGLPNACSKEVVWL